MLILLLLSCNLISIAAQVCLKMGVGRAGPDLKQAALQPLVWAGACLYGTGTILWIKVLTSTDLSFAYPFAATGYAGGILVSQWLLRERVPPARWAGLALIAAGVVCVALSGSSTAH
jgi:drug/metabolite transporter (DMT)-like permease